MRVLVIEDDELVASGIVAGLRLSGIDADHVNCASSAETAAQHGRFDAPVVVRRAVEQPLQRGAVR